MSTRESWSKLSIVQEARWFRYKLDPKSVGTHNIAFSFRIVGSLTVEHLSDALQSVINRHPMLRASFCERDGVPYVRVHDTANVALEVKAAALEDDELVRLVEKDSVRPFLTHTPERMRSILYIQSPDSAVLLVVMDHIASDGWSFWCIFRELRFALSGDRSRLDGLGASYLDWAQWQRDWIESAQALTCRMHWERIFEHAEASPLPLALRSPIHAVNTDGEFSEQKLRIVLPVQLTSKTRQFASQERVTVFSVLLSAYQLLLCRYSGRDEIVVGTVLPGRHGENLRNVVGDFSNPIPVWCKFRRGTFAADAVRVVNSAVRAGMRRQIYPFAKMGRGRRARDVDESIFSTAFVLQDARRDPDAEYLMRGRTDNHPPRWGSLEIQPYPVYRAGDMGGMSLVLEGFELFDEILLDFRFSATTYAPDTLNRFAASFEALLSDLVTNHVALGRGTGSKKWDELALLAMKDRDALLERCSEERTSHDRARTIHEQFENQAARSPDVIAVTFEQEKLSYSELNARSNKMARHLRGLGVGADTLVGIYVERGLEMIVGILGVLKAGGAYVPLDPAYPSERIAFMLQDAQVQVLLTQKALLVNIGVASGVRTLCFDADWSELDAHCSSNLQNRTAPLDLAYVIYTSGSAGIPKGVMVGHNQVVRLFASTDVWFSFGARDVWTLFHSFAFDFSVWEIWGALLYGGRLAIVPQHITRSPKLFHAFLCEQGVTVLNQTPSAFYQLANAQDGTSRSHALRLVIFGGEALEVGALRSWYARDCNAGTQLVNMYGITETTVHVSYCPLNRDDASLAGVSPIGVRIPDLGVYLLDEQLNLVPTGVIGEMYISGDGLARGYLRRPALTAERFLPNPFSKVAGARMYKSGDLARYLPDGNIEYLGRNDFQVKIRGFRIELGEIEARLRACEGVQEAVVIAREESAGDKRLVAYVTGRKQEAALAAGDLRAQLSLTLAEYMIPSAFVTLEAFPLTPNGKLDRKALPAPDANSVVTRQYEEPQGEVEQALARIWQDLLGLERVGRHDNFFELGGHSLLAVQLVSRLRESLGVELGLQDLFITPVLQVLASRISERKASHPNLVPVRINGKRGPVFFVHSGHGAVGYAVELAKWLDNDLSIYALAPTGLSGGETAQESVVEIASRYVEAIRSIQASGPYRIFGWSSGGIIAYEIARQMLGIDEVVDLVGLIDSNFPHSTASLSEQEGYPQAMTELSFLERELSKHGQPSVAVTTPAEIDAHSKFELVLTKARSLGVIPYGVDSTTVRRHLLLRRALESAVSAYAPRRLLAPIALFLAEESRRPETDGWTRRLGANCRTFVVGGSHHSMVDPEHAPGLAVALHEALSWSQAQSLRPASSTYSYRVALQTGAQAVPPLFCIPGSGASVTSFYRLAAALGTEMPVHGLQPRGLDGVSMPHTTVEAAARAYVAAMRNFMPRGPYRLLGHSFGGWIAFEMARQFEQAGEKVEAVILLDVDAPKGLKSFVSRERVLGALLEIYSLSADKPFVLTSDQFAGLNRSEQIQLLLSHLTKHKILPKSASEASLEAIVSVFEDNINTSYVPIGVYRHSVHLVVASGCGAHDVVLENEKSWRNFAPQMTVWRSPGNHLTMLGSPHVEHLAHHVHSILKQDIIRL